jgi:hypothetical protein
MQDRATNERLRRRLVAVNAECRRLIVLDPPRRDRAIFHCGCTQDDLRAFRAFLGAHNPAFQSARTLEELAAGEYLVSVKSELIALGLSPDFDEPRQFATDDGVSFGASLNGLWRGLSARYARACAGIVNAVVAEHRAQVHRQGLQLWSSGQRHGGYLAALRVFGFVEFPILAGALSRNAGVADVRVYRGSANGRFTLIDHVIPSRTATS